MRRVRDQDHVGARGMRGRLLERTHVLALPQRVQEHGAATSARHHNVKVAADRETRDLGVVATQNQVRRLQRLEAYLAHVARGLLLGELPHHERAVGRARHECHRGAIEHHARDSLLVRSNAIQRTPRAVEIADAERVVPMAGREEQLLRQDGDESITAAVRILRVGTERVATRLTGRHRAHERRIGRRIPSKGLELSVTGPCNELVVLQHDLRRNPLGLEADLEYHRVHDAERAHELLLQCAAGRVSRQVGTR